MMLKESNCDQMMKNINVQREVEYWQKYEKIEDLSPHVCMSVRERNPVFCLIFYPGMWDCWMIVLNMMFDFSCSCFWSRNQSDSGDSGRWNIVSIIVPQSSSSDSLDLSKDNSGELCSKGRISNWVPGGRGTGRGGSSSSTTSPSTSPSSWLSW